MNRKVWIFSVISTVTALLMVSVAVAFAAQDGGDQGQKKMTVCHKGHAITVAAPALAAHERHGDVEGACPVGEPAQEGVADDAAEGRDLYGDSAGNTLRGTLHADFLQSGRGPDVVFGSVGNDFIDGVDGISGNDELNGSRELTTALATRAILSGIATATWWRYPPVHTAACNGTEPVRSSNQPRAES